MHQSPRFVGVVAVLLLVSLATAAIGGSAAAVAEGSTDGTTIIAEKAAVTPVSDCRKITTSGYYRLTADLVDRTEDLCIRIFASDVIFDGDGHRIDGVGKYLFTPPGGSETSTKGLLVKQGPHTNVTIRNVEVTDYGYGLWVQGTSEGRIVDNRFRDNGIYGIYLGYDAHANTVADNRIVNTTSPNLDAPGQGIAVANIANRNDIENNYVRASERHGIAVHLGNETRIVNNTVIDSGTHGITGVGDGTEILDNVVEQCGEVGINYRDANGSLISGNEIREAPQGIKLGFSDDVVIRDNVIAGSHHIAILVHGVTGAVDVSGNAIADDPFWDIHSRRHIGPVEVSGLDTGEGTTASFVGRRIAVTGSATPPVRLPEDADPVSGYLKVGPKDGTDAWIDLTLSVDRSAVEEGQSAALWVYRGSWRQVRTTSVGSGGADFSSNLTGLDRTVFVAVGARSDTPPPTDTTSTEEPTTVGPTTETQTTDGPDTDTSQGQGPTAGGGQGFGIASGLLAILVLLRSLFARSTDR